MNQKTPQHLAIVMDGNGRWAEARGLSRVEGHVKGVETVKKIIEHSIKRSIPILSLFAFSSENWSRPQDEVQFLMHLFIKSLEKELIKLHEQKIRLCFVGDRTVLDSTLVEAMDAAEKMTQNNQVLLLNIVLNYGGKWDIVQAAQQLINKALEEKGEPKKINEQDFAQFLSLGDIKDPDLFIRTSGEKRISNFFLWQLAYTELYFTETYWPDFNASEFDKALTEFAQRKRRFGLTSAQFVEMNHV